MRRSGLVALTLLVFVSASCGKENVALDPAKTAGPLATFPSLGGEGSGYLSIPSGEGRKPAVIVIHNKEGYNAQATTDAQQRIDRFFAEKLRANIPNS